MNKPNKHTKLPSGWEMKKLGDLGEIISGLTYKPEMIKENGILVLRSSNVQNRTIVYSDTVYIAQINLKYNPVLEGDILICVRNGSRSLIGKNAMIDRNAEGLAFGAFMSVFRSKHNEYLLHVFDTDIYNREIHINLGATINSINSSELKEFKIPLPPLPEQRAIANILSTWDTAIQSTQALIAKKEAEKKWLMQNLLTGKKRLKGFSGEWKEVRIGDVTKKFSRKNKDLLNCRVYSVTNYDGFVLQSDHFSREVAGDNLTGYKIIRKGEFAYNPARINVGSIAYFKDEVGIISSLYVCFSTNEQILDFFLEQVLKLDLVKHRIEAFGEGGVRVYLWYELFEKIKVSIPDIKEQTAIAQVLQTADKEIELLKSKLEQQKLQKKGLMQVLLTGKVRVKAAKNQDGTKN